MKKLYETIRDVSDLLDDEGAVMAAQGLDRVLYSDATTINPEVLRVLELARLDIENGAGESAQKHMGTAMANLLASGDVNARVCHAFSGWFDSESVAEVYDGPEFAEVLADLMPNYEYPDISWLNVGQLRGFVERYIDSAIATAANPTSTAHAPLRYCEAPTPGA